MAKSSEDVKKETTVESKESTKETPKPAERKRMTREERKTLMETGKQHISEKYFDRENYHYRLTNESTGNVEYRERLGYEIVTDETGHPIRKPANKSKDALNSHAVLMKIPKEDFEEIKAIHKEKTDAAIQSTDPDSNKGQYGRGLVDVKN